MSPKMGLVRIACPSCSQVRFVMVAELVALSAVVCRSCGASQRLDTLLAADEPLARLVEIMRQLDGFRANKLARDEIRLMQESRHLRETALVNGAQKVD